VTAKRAATGYGGDREPGTLGEVLYAQQAAAPISEAEWVGQVRAIAGGDQHGLRAIYDRTHRVVFTLIMRICNDRQSAEELTLDVFHDVWRRASDYDPEGGTVLGWIMNQARSRAIDRRRFEQRKKRVDPLAGSPLSETTAREVDEVVISEAEGRALREALALLSPDERQAIEISYFSELTYSEVAAQLNHPVGTVKTRIRSGLSKLRNALSSRDRDQ
jgi:RNA polymerase sigma-70 factor, ECF subfamily